jgi:hypothetical protein
MNWRKMLPGLLLAALARGDWHEEWQDAARREDRLLAWGRRHVWSAMPQGPGMEWGFPAGIVTVLPGPPAWAALADGRLMRLDGPPAVWQVERECWDALGDGGTGAWLLGPGGVRSLSLAGPSSPEVLRQFGLPAQARHGELRLDGERLWLRLEDELWRLAGDGWRQAGRLPADARDWLPRQDLLLVVDGRGRLLRLLPGGGAADWWPHPAGHSNQQQAWKGLRADAGILWLQDGKGQWWRMEDSGSPVLHCPEDAGSWLPVAGGGLLQQTGDARCWWTWPLGEWARELRVSRPAELRDRLTRWTSRWRLTGDGRLLRRDPGGWRELDRLPGARSLQPAGAGPLVLTESGLEAWADDGRWLGRLDLPGTRDAATLEDHVLVATRDGLASVDTNGDLPELLNLLPMTGLEEVSASPLWVALRSAGMVWLADRSLPGQPRLVDARPLPEGVRGLRLVEDRLYLLGDGGVRLWSCRDGRLTELAEQVPGGGARWALQRGADRLLLLGRDGRLRQLRLVDNLPVAEEWSLELAVAGPMRLAGDTLLVTGSSGWVDETLPPLGAPAPGRKVGGGSVVAASIPATAGQPAGESALVVEAVPGGLGVSWAGPQRRIRRVALYDLAGRRLARAELDASGRATFPMQGLPAGRYVVQELDPSAARARMVSWIP